MKKNVDKTIQVLLYRYRYYMLRSLTKETRRVTYGIYKNSGNRDDARTRLNEINEAFVLLQRIVADPKKYLYWDFDIYHNGLYDDGNPGRKLSDEEKDQSIGAKLQPLGFLKHKHSDKREESWMFKEAEVLPVLSEAIAYHFTPRRDPCTKQIVCDGDLATKYETLWEYKPSTDLFYPESSIFDLSRYVSAITGTRLGAKVKYFLPRILFAQRLSK